MRVEKLLPGVVAQLLDIAHTSAPREACGILTRAGVIRTFPNRSPDPENTFHLAPLDELDRMGEIAAIWHTHPGDEPPSEQDVMTCQATFHPWIIAGPSRIWVIYPEARFYAGREFEYAENDCWALVSDWYAQERKVFLPWFERPPFGWWEEPGESPYVTHAASYGFDIQPASPEAFASLQLGDVLLMKVLARQTNHAAVYVGGGCVLHHLLGHLSIAELFDGRLQGWTTHVCRLRQ